MKLNLEHFQHTETNKGQCRDSLQPCWQHIQYPLPIYQKKAHLLPMYHTSYFFERSEDEHEIQVIY